MFVFGEGTGRYLPGEGSEPVIGSKGKLEEVAEMRVETIFPENIEKKVLAAMIKAHPYEEVAHDIYKLENKGESLGLGKIGVLAEEMTLEQFSEHVKRTLDVEKVRVVGDLQSPIKKWPFWAETAINTLLQRNSREPMFTLLVICITIQPMTR